MNPNYSFKEKKKWLLALMNPDAAALDLALLSEADPRNTQLTAFGLNPARYAEDILFSLLDFKTAEEIRLNRRQAYETALNAQQHIDPPAAAGEGTKDTGKDPAPSGEGTQESKKKGSRKKKNTQT